MGVPVMQLGPSHRPALLRHFLALEGEDVRLRFGHRPGADWIEKYVEGIDFERDKVFGAFEHELELAGVAHLAMFGDSAELGVSVLPGHRGKGIGKALFKRAAGHARNQSIKTLFIHCLAENGAMMHIARTSGMEIVRDASEAEAYLNLPPRDPASVTDEMLLTRLALFDFALKSQLATARVLTAAVGDSMRGKSEKPTDP